jgi:hypothetical protein
MEAPNNRNVQREDGQDGDIAERYPEPEFLPIRLPPKISNANLSWGFDHQSKCRYKCATSREHYRQWKYIYYNHLMNMYASFEQHMNIQDTDQNANSSKINFNDFIVFVYKHSSGYITDVV